MSPLDTAWLLLKGTMGSPEDKARFKAEWAKLQNPDERAKQQEAMENTDEKPVRPAHDYKQELHDAYGMTEMGEELARLEAENAAFRERLNPTPVDEEPVVD